MEITLNLDSDRLSGYADSFLAALWHAAQWNHKPGDDAEACRLVEQIGREIIRRWLANTPPELWQRQGNHEKTLPGIERAAKAGNVLRAANALIDLDPGSNRAEDRRAISEAMEELAREVRLLEEVGTEPKK